MKIIIFAGVSVLKKELESKGVGEREDAHKKQHLRKYW